MQIVDVYLGQEIEEKILTKHGVLREEVEEMLLADEPRYFRTRKGRYSAVGITNRFITVIFEYSNGLAKVITAYCSSNTQIRRYRTT